uniref:OBG-type G domain-containing protein n=1 Tax=Caenorhabditis tropicalis TaxID=1561998 RepID=A0A1I7U343_9PELO
MRLTHILRETVSQVQKLIKDDLKILKVDKYVLNVRAGSGGLGYDGVGGDGGSVFFIAKPTLAFPDIKKRLKNRLKICADHGEASTKTSLIGQHAKSQYFDVPVGIEVVNKNNNTLIARCSKPFHRYLIARGGEGGCAKTGYKGVKGEHFDIEVHLKLRPNLGLLGFPNAGKSTLLQALVPQKSIKIADYAFTTIHPQIAFWKNKTDEMGDEKSDEPSFTLSIADLPGIIEGASMNRGRGYTFLKHLEHADVIAMVVDCQGFQLKNELDCPFRSPLESIALLNREVELYDQKLARKPVICVLNKIDKLNDEEKKKIDKLSVSLLSDEWVSSVPKNMRPTTIMSFENVVQLSAKSGKIERFEEILTSMRSRLHAIRDVREHCREERTAVKRNI